MKRSASWFASLCAGCGQRFASSLRAGGDLFVACGRLSWACYARRMARAGRIWIAVVVSAVVGLGARQVWTQRAPKRAPAPSAAKHDKPEVAARSAAEPPVVPALTAEAARDLRWLAIGGGATPESTEISLEQNMQLARETLPGAGRVLFAGGSGSLSVRTLDEDAPADALLVQLGDLFQPRNGRTSHYVATSL